MDPVTHHVTASSSCPRHENTTASTMVLYLASSVNIRKKAYKAPSRHRFGRGAKNYILGSRTFCWREEQDSLVKNQKRGHVNQAWSSHCEELHDAWRDNQRCAFPAKGSYFSWNSPVTAVVTDKYCDLELIAYCIFRKAEGSPITMYLRNLFRSRQRLWRILLFLCCLCFNFEEGYICTRLSLLNLTKIHFPPRVLSISFVSFVFVSCQCFSFSQIIWQILFMHRTATGANVVQPKITAGRSKKG